MNPRTLDATRLNPTISSWPRLVDHFRRLCGYRFPRLGSVAFHAILRSLPSVIESRLFPGIKATLDLRDETQRTTYWFGTRFEQPTPQVLQEWSAGATHFFDIGSNYGFYSFLLYSFARHLEIYSFEPNPASFRRLTEIQSLNGAARIRAQPYGLSDKNEHLQFLQLFENTGHSSFATVGKSADQNPSRTDACLTECEVIQFDEAVRRLNLQPPAEPRWIAKIDVEGYELKVLKGMTGALSNKAFKGICIELVEENLVLAGATIEQVDGLLRDHGYYPMLNNTFDEDRSQRNPNAFYVPIEVEQDCQAVTR